jgi:hypothetical protein
MPDCAESLCPTERRPAAMPQSRRAFLQTLGTTLVASSCNASIRPANSGELGRGCPNGPRPVFGTAVRSRDAGVMIGVNDI